MNTPPKMPWLADPQLGWVNQWNSFENPQLQRLEQLQRVGMGALCAAYHASDGVTIVASNMHARSMPKQPEGFWMLLTISSWRIPTEESIGRIRQGVKAGYDELFAQPNLSSVFGEPKELIQACGRALHIVPPGEPLDRLWIPPEFAAHEA